MDELVEKLSKANDWITFRDAIRDYVRSHMPVPVEPDKSGYVSTTRQLVANQEWERTQLLSMVEKHPELKDKAKKLNKLHREVNSTESNES